MSVEERREGVGVIHTAPTCPYCGTHKHDWMDWWPREGWKKETIRDSLLLVCGGDTTSGPCPAVYECFYEGDRPYTFRSVKVRPMYTEGDVGALSEARETFTPKQEEE